MKKIIFVVLLPITLFLLTACGSSSLNPNDLSIDSFDWETKESKCDGKDCYTLSLSNKSKYDIIGVYFTYKVKSDTSKRDLRVYDDFISEHEGYIDEDDTYQDITLIGQKNELIQRGEKLTDLRFTIGYKDNAWYDYPTKKQFDLMEPKELQLGIVSGDKLYLAYYSFQNKSWKLDKKTVSLNTWSTKEIGKQLEKPNGVYNVVKTDDEDEFEVYSYSFSEKMFNDYVKKIKSSGFKEENHSEYSFEGTNSLGYHIDLWYSEMEKRLFISLNK